MSDDQYNEFFRYKSGDYEAPQYRLHFVSDAPISMRALLFVGRSHEEKYGMGRLKPGVDLYSRRVLIEGGSTRLMPDWLRFMQGVVDSEDVPLNISRESMQDSALMRRIKATLTRRVLRFLEGESKRDAAAYNSSFFPEFGSFLKEGAVTDSTHAPEIARLLRWESSALPPGELTSFDEYISRMSPGQANIYYIVAPHRGIAETSPYLEAFRGSKLPATAPSPNTEAGASVDDVEVLFLYAPIDDFVMNNLREFGGRKLVTAESADVSKGSLRGAGGDAAAGASGAAPATAGQAGGDAASSALAALSEERVAILGDWLVKTLPSKLSKVGMGVGVGAATRNKPASQPHTCRHQCAHHALFHTLPTAPPRSVRRVASAHRPPW